MAGSRGGRGSGNSPRLLALNKNNGRVSRFSLRNGRGKVDNTVSIPIFQANGVVGRGKGKSPKITLGKENSCPVNGYPILPIPNAAGSNCNPTVASPQGFVGQNVSPANINASVQPSALSFNILGELQSPDFSNISEVCDVVPRVCPASTSELINDSSVIVVSGDPHVSKGQSTSDSIRKKRPHNSQDERPRLLQNDLIEKGENKVVGGRKKKVVDAVNEAHFQQVMELIAGNGNLKNLSIPYHKAYLRKHGLRLAGTKGELLDRVELHVRLKRGEIEEYDKSTFKIECTDVLCGDVIMFQQKEHTRGVTMSSWEASQDRLVVGRVIKEVYRGTKQQHMFMIEVYWSNGYQALDPLSILQIKGSNLYQSKIYRQERKSEFCRPESLEETSGSCIANRESRGGEEETMEIEGVEIEVAYEQPQETVDARKRYKERIEQALNVSTTNLKKVRKKKLRSFCSKNKCPMPASKSCPYIMCVLCCSRKSCKRHGNQSRQKRESESCRPEMLEETRGSCLVNRESREGEEETMKIEGVEIEVNEKECPQELVVSERPQETVAKKGIEQAPTVSTKSKLKKLKKIRVKNREFFCSKKCSMLASKLCRYAMCGLCCSRQSCKRHKNQPKRRSIRFGDRKCMAVTRAASRAMAEQGILEQVS